LKNRVSSVKQHRTKKVALLFGIDKYNAAKLCLKNCVSDVKAMQKLLESMGYTVTVVLNATVKEFIKARKAFNRTLNKGDTVIFYYAGHGMEFENENCFVAADTELDYDLIGNQTISLQGVYVNKSFRLFFTPPRLFFLLLFSLTQRPPCFFLHRRSQRHPRRTPWRRLMLRLARLLPLQCAPFHECAKREQG
jgi:hypothetical protein